MTAHATGAAATQHKGKSGQPRGTQKRDPNLSDLLDSIEEVAASKEKVSVADIQEAIGERSFGPFLVVPALIDLSPIGSIPGLPTVLALTILLIAAQIAWGRRHLWLPQALANRSLDADTLKAAVGKMRPVARWIDAVLRHRLSFLTEGIALRLVAGLCILLTFTVPPLELIPLASSAPMGAIGLIGLGILAKDGFVVIAGALLALVAFALPVWLLVSG